MNGREKLGIRQVRYPKAFIDYLLIIDDVYENLVGFNPTKKPKVSTVFDV